MSTPANLLLAHRFEGAGYPDFAVVWPDFDFPSATGVNLSGWARPVVDGHGRGLPSRVIGNVTWRALSDLSPGTSLYQADLWARWKNPAGAGRREVGLIVRAKGPQDLVVARVRSQIGANPELRVFKISAGVETQLGVTTTHLLLNASAMAAGFRWRVRVEDLSTGDSRVTVYANPLGATGKGTQIFDWTGDLGDLRGLFSVGVELHDQVSGDDVRVDDLEVYDTADEWNPSGPPPAPGAGWQVELAGELYSMDDLAELSPPVRLTKVRQAYGLQGNSASLEVYGDWRMGTLVRPGREVKVLHDGAVRFRGRVERGSLDGLGESQSFECFDGYYAARQIGLREDDGSVGHHFNVADDEAPEYDAERVDLTLGQILKWLFDRYLARLRFYGCASSTGVPYVQAELDELDAVVPDVAVTGTFVAALETVLRYVAHRWLVWWDPADLTFHFRDVTTVSAETVTCTAEWVKFRINPDRGRAYTAVEWIGALKERVEDITLKLSDGSLTPAWTKEQEDRYGKGKRSRTLVATQVLSAGTGVAPDKIVRDYVDVPLGLLETDDIRGWAVTVNGFLRLVTNNSASRVWLSPPNWASPPALGTQLIFSAVDPEAMAELSAAGVGRGYYLHRPETIDPGCLPSSAKVHQGGFCGEARSVEMSDDGTIGYGEQFQFNVRYPSEFQRAAGFCTPVVTLSQKPGAFWFAGHLIIPKGSVPTGGCEPGVENKPAQIPLVDVQIKVPQDDPSVPYLREPPEADSFEGSAFTDWEVQQVYTVNDPDFTSMDQEAGLRKAAQAILAVKKEKPYLLDLELAAPWHVTTSPDFPVKASTSRWAGLAKRVQIASALRPTGFESTEKLPLFGVTFDVEGNSIQLECGSTAGWLEASGVDVARGISEARVLKKALTEVKRLEDFRNRLIQKAADRIGGVPQPAISGCEVRLGNDQLRRVVDVQKDDEDKIAGISHAGFRGQLDASLVLGVEPDFPGAPISVPGRDGPAAQRAIDGPVLRPYADHTVLFKGADPRIGGALGDYGGPTVTDEAADGQPPREVRRLGGFVWRKQEDANGNPNGGPGLEYAAVDARGNPTGPWTPYRRPSDLPGGLVPLKVISPGSVTDQLLERTRELARALGRVEDSVGRLLAAGDRPASHPDGVPADLATHLRVQGFVGNLELVPETFSDPGGPVWTGPKTSQGVSAGLYWRVLTPELVLARVTPTTYGLGMNGGAWALDVSGPGGSTEFLSTARVIHKQAHPGELEWDARHAMVASATPFNPFGFDKEGMVLGTIVPGSIAGAGALFPVPEGVRAVLFQATVGENQAGVAVPSGRKYAVRIDYAWRASPWSGVVAGTPSMLTADGTNSAVGVFKQPGGAVPPGLRVPSDSVLYLPGAGSAPAAAANASVVVIGTGVELAVVEGGYLVRMRDGIDVDDAWVHNHPAAVEAVGVEDVWTLSVVKALAEGLAVGETWGIELNPPLEVFENLELGEAWSIEHNGVPVYP